MKHKLVATKRTGKHIQWTCVNPWCGYSDCGSACFNAIECPAKRQGNKTLLSLGDEYIANDSRIRSHKFGRKKT